MLTNSRYILLESIKVVDLRRESKFRVEITHSYNPGAKEVKEEFQSQGKAREATIECNTYIVTIFVPSTVN